MTRGVLPDALGWPFLADRRDRQDRPQLRHGQPLGHRRHVEVIAPTLPGPQPFGGGGEMCLWTSRDQGKSWALTTQITAPAR